jgi:hypothetical protein
MSLTGILLDVSGSMEENIKSETDEQSGPWAHSIFKVVDNVIKHDISPENHVFAIGVGGNCAREIFDVIGTVEQIENMEMPSYCKNAPATKEHINEILNILEKNGARNIRKWANDITLIQNIVPDHMTALMLRRVKSDGHFLRRFVDEFLPSACREKFNQPAPIINPAVFINLAVMFIKPAVFNNGNLPGDIFASAKVFAEDTGVRVASYFRPATSNDIHEVIEKAKCDFLRDIDTNSIVNVQHASALIRGCVGEKELNELSTKRTQELLENIEPFIYGRTPLYESLEKATKLFEAKGASCDNMYKLLFVLSDGKPTDGSNEDIVKINQITSKLRKAGVKIVSCFISASTDIQPKRLYDEMQLSWEPGAKFLFSLSSEVPTQHLPRAILVKRGWTIDIANNETKLFMQVNHPDNLR